MKHTMKNMIVILTIALSSMVYADDYVFQAGERLEYEVSFMDIGLGTIVLEVIGTEIVDEKEAYHVTCNVESYQSIPFLKFKTVVDSWISKDASKTYKWTTNSYLSGVGWSYIKLFYCSEKDSFRLRKWHNKELTSDVCFIKTDNYHDGLSIFSFARKHVGCGKKITVATIHNEEISSTEFRFYNKNEQIQVSSIPYKVQTIYLKGQINGEGSYGLKGEFEGWFSKDEARVPMLAYLNLYIGKVKIELKKWNRKNWRPPAVN